MHKNKALLRLFPTFAGENFVWIQIISVEDVRTTFAPVMFTSTSWPTAKAYEEWDFSGS